MKLGKRISIALLVALPIFIGGIIPLPSTFIKAQSNQDLPFSAPRAGMEDQPAPVEDPPFDPPDEDDGPTIYDEEIPTKTESIIYVLDISGSMSWDSRSYTGLDGSILYGPRIDRAKTELSRSIAALSSNFYFNVFAYDCDIRRWSASKQKADPAPKSSAIAWSMALRPQGATGTGPAVAAALGDKDNFAVILLSDGSPNCGANSINGHLAIIQAANTQRAAITCFGIACYGNFERFMRDIAQTSGGRYIGVP